MNKSYWNLVEDLDTDQSILQETTKALIWKKAYSAARKIAKKEIKKLEEDKARRKLVKERIKEIDARKLAKKAAEKALKLKKKAKRAKARRKKAKTKV